MSCWRIVGHCQKNVEETGKKNPAKKNKTRNDATIDEKLHKL